MIKRVLLAIIPLLLFSSPCTADFFCRRHDFTSTNGLMKSHISNAQQDANGFMWFATWNGLIRYDGYRFHTFKPIQCSDGTIYSNRIYNIKMSRSGNIWCVSSDNRLFIFNTSTCKFADVQSRIPLIDRKKVKVLTPLKNGAAWVTFKDYSCIRLTGDGSGGGYIYMGCGSRSLGGGRKIYGISMDEGDNEWILTDRGAANVTRKMFVRGQFRHVHSVAGHTFLIGDDGRFVRLNAAGRRESGRIAAERVSVTYVTVVGSRIVCATDRGVYSVDGMTLAGTCHNTPPATYLFKDSRKRIWTFGNDNRVSLIPDAAATRSVTLAARSAQGGPMKNPQLIMEDARHNIILKPCRGVLSYYDEAAGTLRECLFHDDEGDEVYAPADIKKFLADRDRNLWVFHSGGVDCISFFPSFFRHVRNARGLETRAMMCDTGGRYWLADRSNAICLFDRDMTAVGCMGNDGRTGIGTPRFSAMPIYCMRESPRHDVWIGTKGEGVYLLEPVGGGRAAYDVTHLRHVPTDGGSLRSDSIYDIAFVGGTVYMGSYGDGLSRGTRTADRWRFEKVANQPAGMKIRCIVDVGGGILLLGTADGLVTADMRNARRPRFYVNRYRGEAWGLKGNDIMSIVRCGGRFYACVFGSGVSRIDSDCLLSDSLHFTNYMIPSAETADQIKTAVAEGGNIWVVSERAITCFSTATGLYNTYTRNSFTGDFGFSEAAPVSLGGRITVGTSDGTVSFDSGDMAGGTTARRISVTGIQYQNDMTVYPLNNPAEITISPERRSFSVYISAMEYGGQGVRRFRYRLTEYDRGWNYTQDSHPAAIYNNLPPGRHRLIVETTGDSGRWEESGGSVDIYVVPRFTETVWFRIMLAAAAFLIVAGMIYAIIYLKKMRNIIQRKYSLMMTVDEIDGRFGVGRGAEDDADSDGMRDRAFIEASAAFFNENIDNQNLVVEDFARHLGMSRTAYYNRMKQITGLSPMDFIKQMRIKKALKLLDEGGLSIAETAYRTGFSDPKYFSRCFKAEMNMTPTQYVESRRGGRDVT